MGVPGDKSALVPYGIRLGTPALTSRGLGAADFDQVAAFIDRGVKITQEIKAAAEKPTTPAFRKVLASRDWPQIGELKAEVEDFAKSFPTVGFERADMRYTD